MKNSITVIFTQDYSVHKKGDAFETYPQLASELIKEGVAIEQSKIDVSDTKKAKVKK
jgi:hypothetical protein